MIEKIEIKNFKSIADLSFELGRVNVLIGANGTGKSNILEAIAFGGAAAADKLDNEFLASRGIRVTEAKLMKSGFAQSPSSMPVIVKAALKDESIFNAILNPTNNIYPIWENVFLKNIHAIYKMISEGDKDKLKNQFGLLFDTFEDISNVLSNIHITSSDPTDEDFSKYLPVFVKHIILESSKRNDISSFVIFSPENSSVRTFEKEGQVLPLGINGEGLFLLLRNLFDENPDKLQKINEKLRLVEWFDGFDMPTNLIADQAYLKIKDRYLDETLQNFDQRSSNEGFLFLLFYFTLFIADETPKFFAVDNVDAALNPKLAARLMQELTVLSKEHDKQVILTTHNPALLDGLDLTDDEVRLYVVYRSVEGHTALKRVTRQKPRPGKEQVPLSEAFLRGYIGGLPSNF